MTASGRDQRRRLRELIERELASPRPFEEVAREFPELVPGTEGVADVLRALARADRARFWVRAERRWHQRFGWRLIRPLMFVGLAGAAVAVLQSAFEPTAALILFLTGAASLYIVLQVYTHLWSRSADRRLAEIEREFRDELGRLRDAYCGGGDSDTAAGVSRERPAPGRPP